MKRKHLNQRIERLRAWLQPDITYGLPPIIEVRKLPDGSILPEDQARIDRIMEERAGAPGIKVIVVRLAMDVNNNDM